MMSMRMKDVFKKKILLALSLGNLFFASSSLALAADLPVQGAGTFNASTEVVGDVMKVYGAGTNNVLNWQNFDIAAGKTVRFDAVKDAETFSKTNNYLNLVNGSEMSKIYGTMEGGNNVYLINPNGVLFGAESSVNVGNLHVSTRALSEVDVNNFSSTGANPMGSSASSVTGDITNMGNLVANKVVLEGNNILLQNSADLKNDSTQLTGEDVVLKAKGDIDVGQERIDKTIVTKVNETQFANDDASYNSVSGLGWTTTDLAGNSKSATDYKLIHNIYELQNMKNNLSGNYMLANDIDASVTSSWNDGQGFAPIRSFTGKLQGANQTINNLYINRSAECVGLFANTTDATVVNVGMVDSDIKGNNSTGSLVGQANGGTITGYNTGKVSGDHRVGGLVGSADNSTITGYNTGAVSGTGNRVGGLVGQATQVNLSGYNLGEVKGSEHVGGLVGTDNGESTIKGYNTRAVSGKTMIGGLAGYANKNSIITGYNTGDVTGSVAYLGGLLGYAAENLIVTGYNEGKVSEATSGTAYAIGGLVGWANKIILTGYNLGEVNGNEYVGGLLGNDKGGSTIVGYNTENISGKKCVGGLVGAARTGSTVTGYNTGDVSGTAGVGGLAGYKNNATLTGFVVKKSSDGETLVVDYEGMNDDKKDQELSTAKDIDTFIYEKSPWDISNKGGDEKTWRLYEGYTYPLLNKANNYEFLKPLDLTTTESFEQVYNGKTQTIDSLALVGDEHVLSTETASKDVGTYDVTPYSDQQGYDIKGDMKLEITKKDLTLTADPATSIMGQPIEKLSGTANGFISGEGLEEDLLTWTTSATPSSAAGDYAINGSFSPAYLDTYGKNYNIINADSNATAYSITSNEQEKIAGYLAQEADYNLIVRALEPASNVQKVLLDASALIKGSEPTKREGAELSEESKANLK